MRSTVEECCCTPLPGPPEGGRIIVNPDDNAMFEPAADWLEPQYENGSPAQQKHQGHTGKNAEKDPHGHEYAEGPGPNQSGPSLSIGGQVVPPNSLPHIGRFAASEDGMQVDVVNRFEKYYFGDKILRRWEVDVEAGTVELSFVSL